MYLIFEASYLKLVRLNLSPKSNQDKMKQRYSRNTKERSFKPRDKILALLPIPGRPLQARYFGPYTVEEKVSKLYHIYI